MKQSTGLFALGAAAMLTPLLALGGGGGPPGVPVMDSWGLVGLSALLGILGGMRLLRRK